MKEYKVIGYSCDPMHFSDDDDVWESIDHPKVNWLKRQREDGFSIKTVSRYMYRGTHVLHTQVCVVFLDTRLETEFLLKFGNDITCDDAGDSV